MTFTAFKVLISWLLLSIVLINGCISLPEISAKEVAEICNVDENSIEVSKRKDTIEFRIKEGIISQFLRIFVGPTSISHLNEIKKAQAENNLREYPYIGDGAFIHSRKPLFIRTMWLIDGEQTYRVQSIIPTCSNDTKLIELAGRILKNYDTYS